MRCFHSIYSQNAIFLSLSQRTIFEQVKVPQDKAHKGVLPFPLSLSLSVPPFSTSLYHVDLAMHTHTENNDNNERWQSR